MDGYTVQCREPDGAQTPADPLTTIRLRERTMAADQSTKFCRKCGQTKPRTEFHRARKGVNAYCKPCALAHTAAWRKANPEKLAEYNKNWRPRELRRLYGLTKEQYWQMVRDQGGACAICKTISDKFTLRVDHCHTTGKVRGLLCGTCNSGLGFLKDSPKLLESALRYLGRV